MNKSGQGLEITSIVISIIVIALTVIILAFVLEIVAPRFVAVGASNSMFEYTATAFNLFDKLIIFMTISLGLSAIIGAFMVDSHPAVFILSVLGLFTLVTVNLAIGNAWDRIMLDSPFRILATTTFNTMFIWVRNLPKIMIVVGVFISVALASKLGGQNL